MNFLSVFSQNPLDGGVVNNLVGLGRVRHAAANQNEANNAGEEQPAANEDEQEEDGVEGVEGANNGNNGAQGGSIHWKF